MSAANLLPEVWVPPPEIRELRQLIAHRSRLIKQRGMLKNRLSAVLQRHALIPPEGELFQSQQATWWHALKLGSVEMLRVRQDWQQLQALTPLIQAVDEQIIAISQDAQFAHAARLLIQLPGISVLGAMTLIAAIGDVTRFASDTQLVGYSGLGAQVHASGEVNRHGPMSKTGRRDIRTIMIEAAWNAVNSKHPFWLAEFSRLSKHLHPNKAIGAIARRLLVAVWHVWTKAEADRHGIDSKVTQSYERWGHKLKKAGRKGLTTKDFVREQLDALALGSPLAAELTVAG
jgi:transposase